MPLPSSPAPDALHRHLDEHHRSKRYGQRYGRDDAAAGLMLIIGATAIVCGRAHTVGSLSNMGPGFFPICLGIALALLGITIAITARLRHVGDVNVSGKFEGDFRAAADPTHGRARQPARVCADGTGAIAPPASQWRAWLCIVASVLAFVLLGRWGGLIPASFAVTFVAALGDRENRWPHALLLALLTTAFSVACLSYVLQIQLPLFTWG